MRPWLWPMDDVTAAKGLEEGERLGSAPRSCPRKDGWLRRTASLPGEETWDPWDSEAFWDFESRLQVQTLIYSAMWIGNFCCLHRDPSAWCAVWQNKQYLATYLICLLLVSFHDSPAMLQRCCDSEAEVISGCKVTCRWPSVCHHQTGTGVGLALCLLRGRLFP